MILIIKKVLLMNILKLNKENIYNDDCSNPNWQRINIIEEFDNNIILGIGGEENLRNIGKLLIFYRI